MGAGGGRLAGAPIGGVRGRPAPRAAGAGSRLSRPRRWVLAHRPQSLCPASQPTPRSLQLPRSLRARWRGASAERRGAVASWRHDAGAAGTRAGGGWNGRGRWPARGKGRAVGGRHGHDRKRQGNGEVPLPPILPSRGPIAALQPRPHVQAFTDPLLEPSQRGSWQRNGEREGNGSVAQPLLPLPALPASPSPVQLPWFSILPQQHLVSARHPSLPTSCHPGSCPSFCFSSDAHQLSVVMPKQKYDYLFSCLTAFLG